MSRKLRTAAGACAVVLSCLLCIAVFYKFPADLWVPLVYSGDALEWLATVKGALLGDVYTNQFAPFEIEKQSSLIVSILSFIVMPLWLLLLHLYHLASGDLVFAVNAYFYTTYLLASLTMFWLLSYYRCSWPWAIAFSLVFAFLPTHQYRSVYHLLDTSYFLVPLYVLIILWVMERDPLFFKKGKFSLKNKKALVAVLVLAWASPTSTYISFFAAFFAVIAGAYATIIRRNFRYLISAGLVIVLLSISLSKTSWPLSIEKIRDPAFAEAIGKVKPGQPISRYGHAEEYGLKITQLLLPVDEHRVKGLAELKSYYNKHNPLVNENSSAALGFTGSVGFLALVVILFVGKKKQGLLRHLSLLTMAGVLFATVGGFSSIVSLFANWAIPNSLLADSRAFNRISVFIACMSLFALAMIIDRRTRHLNVYARAMFAMSLTVISLLDMLPEKQNDHELYAPYYEWDRAFFHQLEAKLPDRARVLQLPLQAHHRKPSYQDAYIPRLHTEDVVWSFAADWSSEQMKWYQETVLIQGCELNSHLLEYQFSGVLLDRSLAGNRQPAYFEQLNCLHAILESEDRRFVYFSLLD